MTPLPWGAFARADPVVAEAGRALLYQFGPGLAFLATVRHDGAPRLHPVCPVVVDDGLYVFVGNQTPKVADLRRDGRYALHAFPPEAVDDEFCVSGRARAVDDRVLHDHVLEVYLAQGTTTRDHTLFELLIDRSMHAAYEARGRRPPTYSTWRAPG